MRMFGQNTASSSAGAGATFVNPTFSGQSKFPNGTALAPSISNLAGDTGIFFTAPNYFNLSVGATQVLQFNNNYLGIYFAGGAFQTFQGGIYEISPPNTALDNYWQINAGQASGVNSRLLFIRAQGSQGTNVVVYMRNHGVSVGGGSGNPTNSFSAFTTADKTDVASGIRTSANATTNIVNTGTDDPRSFFGVGDRISLSSAASTYAYITAIDQFGVTVNSALGDGTANQSFNRKSAIFNMYDANTVSQCWMDDLGQMTIGATTTQLHKLNTTTSAAAAGVLTMTNGPTGKSGNPAAYINITVNGTSRVIPCW